MTRLSNRQWPMLRALYDNGVNSYMSIDEAQHFDQRPFRSMLIRQWCAYRPGRGFHITREGKAAMHEFPGDRHHAQELQPAAYGLHAPKRAPVHEIRRGAA